LTSAALQGYKRITTDFRGQDNRHTKITLGGALSELEVEGGIAEPGQLAGKILPPNSAQDGVVGALGKGDRDLPLADFDAPLALDEVAVELRGVTRLKRGEGDVVYSLVALPPVGSPVPMPRSAPLDILGLLQHVIARGIECEGDAPV